MQNGKLLYSRASTMLVFLQGQDEHLSDCRRRGDDYPCNRPGNDLLSPDGEQDPAGRNRPHDRSPLLQAPRRAQGR